MSQLELVQKLAGSEVVKLSLEFEKDLHKRLVLGQTRYMCRWGTLSDGHEKITDAQRYYQAIREMYYLAGNIVDQQAEAKLAEADVLEHEQLANSLHAMEHVKLRAQGMLERAKLRLTRARITIQDQLRMLDEYNRVYKELKPVVEAKYPEGIEQAEADNWSAVARYRAAIEESTGQRQMLRHIPLDPKTKARLGIETDKPELVAWLATREMDALKQLASEAPVVPGTQNAPSLKSLVRQLVEG